VYEGKFGRMEINEARRLKELERALKSAGVLEWLQMAIAQHGAPVTSP
jgi:hypothetical protein